MCSVRRFAVSVGDMMYKRKTQKEIRPNTVVIITNSSTPAIVSLSTDCC
jgi:hypothetical protein